MIKIILIFLFLATSAIADSYWQKLQSPTSFDLKNVFFINNNTGWISGDSGTILKTTNSGDNWSIQFTGMSNNIQHLNFINERLGWAIAWVVFPDSNSFLGTRMLKTTDGGSNWTNYMYPDSNMFMKSIYFIDSLKGFMTGAPISIAYTVDGGISWRYADTDTTLELGLPIENIKFLDSQTGFACGGFRDLAGCMWKTTNGGFNWNAQITGPEPLNDLYILNSQRIISVGGDFEYGSSTVNTTNGGANWIYDTLGVFGVASSMDFRTPYEAWLTLGVAQKFLFSVDTGHSWRSISTPENVPIFDVFFADSLHGWATGYSGTILKYTGPKVNVQSNIYSSPNNFTLYQNYPNPFNPETKISFQLESNSRIQLKVYNSLGKEVASLINKRLESGHYSIIWDALNFPSGIYYYELRSDDNEEVKKMLLLK